MLICYHYSLIFFNTSQYLIVFGLQLWFKHEARLREKLTWKRWKVGRQMLRDRRGEDGKESKSKKPFRIWPDTKVGRNPKVKLLTWHARHCRPAPSGSQPPWNQVPASLLPPQCASCAAKPGEVFFSFFCNLEMIRFYLGFHKKKLQYCATHIVSVWRISI